MTRKQFPKGHTTVHDGYNRQILQEGYVRKWGINVAPSQIKVRPAAPAAMQPGQALIQTQNTPLNQNDNH